jgi:type IV pilus assembly protein PilE
MQTSRTWHVTAAGPRGIRGFTLIELVVAMLIVSILAAIAIPSYSNYVRKARRVEVKNALLDMGTMEERYFTSQQLYTQTWADLGYSGATAITLPSGYYSVAVPTITAANPPSATSAGTPALWSFTATALVDQLKDTSCRTFTVNSQGQQTSQDSGGVDSTATCWK